MEVLEFEWDEANIEKVARRGYDPDQLDSVLEGRVALLKNKSDRAGTHRVVGRTGAGALVTVILRPTTTVGRWRPVNAWPPGPEEAAHARRHRV